MAIAMPICLVLMILGGRLVGFWVGPGFSGSGSVLLWIGAVGAVGSLTTVPWQIVGGLGLARWAALIAITYAAVDLAASIALAYPLGPPGVALGSLVGLTTVNLPLVVGKTLRLLNLSMRSWARSCLLPHFAPTALTAGALPGFRFADSTAAIWLVAVVAIASCGVYEVCYWLTGCPVEERAALLALIRRYGLRLRRRPAANEELSP